MVISVCIALDGSDRLSGQELRGIREMALKDDLIAKVREYSTQRWGDIPNGYVVPTAEQLTFANSGVRINACVLYADLHRSTEMVDALSDTLAAEYYKAYLFCAAKIVKDNEGEITAYDGDRVMAIYKGDDDARAAVITALQLHYAVNFLVNPIFRQTYGYMHRDLQHTVGIDYGRLLVAKTGVRIDSDLVWVGPAANYAAKLNSFDGLNITYPTRATKDVLARLKPGDFYRKSDGGTIWDGPYVNVGKDHYRSNIFLEIA